MEADAEAKRKAEEADNESTDESVASDAKDLDDVQRAETWDKPAARKRVKRGSKKGQSSKGNGKGQ